MKTASDVKEIVKQRYGEVASRVGQGAGGSCCGPAASCCGAAAAAPESWDPITSDLYDAAQAGDVPAKALLASLGCGNPTALAELKPGETVLDLGSGGGIDVLLSARRVGPGGRAFGLDMTDPMLALAEENKRKSGLGNVHFLKGEIEDIPLPDNSVDVVISNCVINLSADKDRVLKEAFRVLKPGGRFAVSDIVVRGTMPPALRQSMDIWVGCIGGALSEEDYLAKLAAAGFEQTGIEITRIYTVDDARGFLAGQGPEAERLAEQADGRFASGFIRALKPVAIAAEAGVAKPTSTPTVTADKQRSCCSSTCCN